jgi:hypothetical protein
MTGILDNIEISGGQPSFDAIRVTLCRFDKSVGKFIRYLLVKHFTVSCIQGAICLPIKKRSGYEETVRILQSLEAREGKLLSELWA